MPSQSYKTLCLEYRAFGGFDGVTPAPEFSTGVLDTDRQIYVFEAVNIGLIPLQFDDELAATPGGGTIARKVMSWMTTYGQTVNPPPTGVLTLAIANYGDVSQPPLPISTLVIQDAPPVIGVYSQHCASISQGYALRVSNLLPLSPDFPALLRIRIVQPESPEDEASWMSACCCKTMFLDYQIPSDD